MKKFDGKMESCPRLASGLRSWNDRVWCMCVQVGLLSLLSSSICVTLPLVAVLHHRPIQHFCPCLGFANVFQQNKALSPLGCSQPASFLQITLLQTWGYPISQYMPQAVSIEPGGTFATYAIACNRDRYRNTASKSLEGQAEVDIYPR